MKPQERKEFELALEMVQNKMYAHAEMYLKEALAQQSNEQVEPVAKKWILHGGFADVASFDAEGFPSFYSKESVAKFNNGKLNTACKGKNCGSLNGWLHSAECRAEHEAQYATPPQSEQNPQRSEDINLSCKSTQARLAASWGYVKAEPLSDEQIDAIDIEISKSGYCQMKFARAIEAAHGIGCETTLVKE